MTTPKRTTAGARLCLVVICLAMSACSEENREATRAAPKAASSQAITEIVTLLDAGQEPLAQLRYVFAADQGARGILNTRILRATPSEQAGHRAARPELKMGVAYGPTRVESSPERSSLKTEIHVFRADVRDSDGSPDRLVEIATETLSFFESPQAELIIDDRGISLAIDEGSPNPGGSPVDPRLLPLIASLRGCLRAVPLPEEPVGPGAVWLVQRTVVVMGVPMEESSHYQISELSGSELFLNLQVKYSANPGKPSPGDGHELELDTLHAELSGGMTIDLGSPVPQELTGHFAASIRFQAPAQGTSVLEQQAASVRLYMRRPQLLGPEDLATSHPPPGEPNPPIGL